MMQSSHSKGKLREMDEINEGIYQLMEEIHWFDWEEHELDILLEFGIHGKTINEVMGEQ